MTDYNEQIVKALNKRDLRSLRKLESKVLQKSRDILQSIHSAKEAVVTLVAIEKADRKRAKKATLEFEEAQRNQKTGAKEEE